MRTHREEACVDDEPTAVQLAQELCERGEVHLALSVLLEAMNALPRGSPGANNRTEWTMLVELLNKVSMLRAAEKAFEIASFLGRVGLVPHDENNDGRDAIYAQDDFDNQHRPAAGCAAECSLSSHCTLPSLVSDDSDDTSSASGGDSTLSSPWVNDTRRSRFRHKRRALKTSIETTFKSVFKKRKDPQSRFAGNQKELPTESNSHRSDQEEDEYSFRDRGHQAKYPVIEQSTSRSSRSWSCGLWALSECDVLERSQISEGTTTSYAVADDQRTHRQAQGDFTKLARERGFIRFFGSFLYRSPHDELSR